MPGLDEKATVHELLRKSEQRLAAARYLLEEGFYEDSANRAYYSMFFAATALLLTRGITIRTHRGLIATFGSEFIQTGFIDPEFGKALRIAEELREEVDYSILRVLLIEEVQAVINDAERFLEKTKEKIR
ncbi:MAG: HEPN domain-containing protein [Methanomicrobiales archaeon HGW-Methanomicrobiales-2]|nr:MAG: HEPN domain-containing protein [Methanomicrobiales archaeon HGW-Methanomicrobiales-2]